MEIERTVNERGQTFCSSTRERRDPIKLQILTAESELMMMCKRVKTTPASAPESDRSVGTSFFEFDST